MVVLPVADDLHPVLFEDSLVAFSDSNDKIGKFSVNVTSTDNECIEVKSSSTAVIEDVPCGTVLSACLSRTGQTLQQNHFEYAKVCKNLFSLPRVRPSVHVCQQYKVDQKASC